ncbi:MAG: hypothetical protein IKB34_06080, partial [Clostridia bacterium]|nr:hypothetical protein [Clostridia bacterium]
MATKIKIGSLQKSLKKNGKEFVFGTSKELVSKMVSLGFTEVKTHNDVIGDAEFNLLMASLSNDYSPSEISDIKSYINGDVIVEGYSRVEKETVQKPAASVASKKEEAPRPQSSPVKKPQPATSATSLGAKPVANKP